MRQLVAPCGGGQLPTDASKNCRVREYLLGAEAKLAVAGGGIELEQRAPMPARRAPAIRSRTHTEFSAAWAIRQDRDA